MSLFWEFKIKWWDKFNQELCSDRTVIEFINTGKKLHHQIQQVAKTTASPLTPKSSTRQTPITIQEEDSDSEDEFQQFLQFQKFNKMQKQLNRSRANSTASSASTDPIGGQDPFDM